MNRCRIATFNVKNLFLPAGEALQPAIQGALPKRRSELRALARALELTAADIVALQEVGSITALAAVNELLSEPYPHLLLQPGNSDRGIHLAFASRIPAALVSHQDLPLRDEGGEQLEDYASAADAAAGRLTPLKLQRDLIRFDPVLSRSQTRAPVTLFNLHLKSPNQPAWTRLSAQDLRTAECRLIAAVVSEFMNRQPEAAVIILGDFNDRWESAALEPLRRAGFAPADEGPAEGMPASFWPLGITIDHILVNRNAAHRVVAGSLSLVDDKRCRRGSDHAPVLVDLSW